VPLSRPSSEPLPDPAAFSARRRAQRDADGALVVDLGGDLDLSAVAMLVRVVEDALDEGDVVLDLDVVDFVALAGLDALAALAVTARHRERRLRAVHCSRAVTRTAALASQIGLDIDLDGLATHS
jgi:anti-anti-sigma factor